MNAAHCPHRRRVAMAAIAASAVVAAPAWARAARTLTFSHTDTPNGARHAAAEFFARRLRELSDGRLQTVVFHSGQLGNDPRGIELLAAGRLDFTVSAIGSYASLNPELALAMLPYLVDRYEQGWALVDGSAWFAAAFAKLPARGVRVLSSLEAGFRSFSTREPMRLPNPSPGQPMRIFANDMLAAIVTALGYAPRVMGITDVYLALQRGEVVGQENPIDTIWSQRFHVVAPHLTLTQHVYSPIPLAVSEHTWSSLDDAGRAAVRRAATEAASFSRQQVVQSESRLLDAMAREGARIVRPDLAAWREALRPVQQQAVLRHGSAARNLLAEASALSETIPLKP